MASQQLAVLVAGACPAALTPATAVWVKWRVG